MPSQINNKNKKSSPKRKQKGATILKLSDLPEVELSEEEKLKRERFRKLLLAGHTMTKKQIKEYEKRYPWLKKYRD